MTNLEKLFIPFETGIPTKIKSIGFSDTCLGCFAYGGNGNLIMVEMDNDNDRGYTAAPMYQQVIDWLREEHCIKIAVDSCMPEKYLTKYTYSIDGVNERASSASDNYIYVRPTNNHYIASHSKHKGLPVFHGEYYEALIKAIEEALKLITK